MLRLKTRSATWREWDKYPGVRFKILPARSHDSQQRLFAAADIVKDKDGKLTFETNLEKATATGYIDEHLLPLVEDWQGVVNGDGGDLPCTEENVRELIFREPDFKLWLVGEADALGETLVDAGEEEEKKASEDG